MEKKKCKLLKISIALGIVILLFLIYDFTPILKVPIGNMMLGKEQCTLNEIKNNDSSFVGIKLNEDENHPSVALGVVSKWKCRLCWRIQKHPSSPVPKLCELCANLTNRCEECGELIDVLN